MDAAGEGHQFTWGLCLCLEGVLVSFLFSFSEGAWRTVRRPPSIVGISEFLPAQVSTENSLVTGEVTAHWGMQGKAVALWGEHWKGAGAS